MRWFKHLSTASDDEKLSILIEKFGMEGYGIYWRILEIIAQQLNYSTNPEVAYTPKKWRNCLWITCGKLFKFLQFCHETEIFVINFQSFDSKNSKISSTFDENSSTFDENLEKSKTFLVKNDKLSTVEIISICAPNLLKYRDEYTVKKGGGQDLNSGHSPDNVRSRADTHSHKDTEQSRIDATKRAVPTFLFSEEVKEISANFVPSKDAQKLCKEYNVDFDRERNKFVDHFLSTGEKRKDWDAVFRNWIRRTEKYKK